MFSKRTYYFLFITFSLFILVGGSSYSVFYDEIHTRLTGEGVIDWERIAAICGWAGSPAPGETLWEYRFRSTWNMISAQMGMTAIYMGMMLLFFLMVRVVFWITDKKEKKPTG